MNNKSSALERGMERGQIVVVGLAEVHTTCAPVASFSGWRTATATSSGATFCSKASTTSRPYCPVAAEMRIMCASPTSKSKASRVRFRLSPPQPYALIRRHGDSSQARRTCIIGIELAPLGDAPCLLHRSLTADGARRLRGLLAELLP